MQWDVIVVGAGGIGSQAMLALADRGLRVLGLDRFALPLVGTPWQTGAVFDYAKT